MLEMEQQELEIGDPRVEFLADYVIRTMKLRPERWQRMYATEENKQICLDFFEKVMYFLIAKRYR
jgi:dynein heavy chain